VKHDTSSKLITASKLALIAKKARQNGRRMVFTNGCFDILHVGHISYLEKARSLGDYMVIGLNSDRSVRSLKGPGRPVNDEKSRARVIGALECVDHVVIFGSTRVTPLVEQLQPEIYVKGGDYTVESLDPGERGAIQSYGGRIRILPLSKGYSTTKTIGRIQAKP
jgi:D-glycero-beta-D-manno-heptose 1-phosphate adenylyltransferase